MNGCCPPIPPVCQSFNIPGPPGANAYSFLTANIAIPPDTATPISISMGSTAWVVPGMYIIIGDQVDGRGTFVVQSVTSPTTVSAIWADAAGDSVSGTVLNVVNNPVITGTGAPGLSGGNGVNAFTILTANSAIPVDTNTPVTFSVANSQWAVPGQTIVVGDAVDGIGTFRVTSVPDSTHITALWIDAVGDAAPLAPLLTVNLATVSPAGVPATPKFRFITSATLPTSGTGETTLASISVPANTMVNNGDSLEFEATFNLTGGSGNNTIKVYFGATTITTWGPFGTSSGIVIIRGRVIRISNTSEFAYATTLVGGVVIAQGVETASASPTETLSGAVLLRCTGQASAGAFNQNSFIVRLFPA